MLFALYPPSFFSFFLLFVSIFFSIFLSVVASLGSKVLSLHLFFCALYHGLLAPESGSGTLLAMGERQNHFMSENLFPRLQSLQVAVLLHRDHGEEQSVYGM